MRADEAQLKCLFLMDLIPAEVPCRLIPDEKSKIISAWWGGFIFISN
jgi:hypothetical protein